MAASNRMISPLSWRTLALILSLLLVFIIFVTGLYVSDWHSYDWWVYSSALQDLLSGQSPYHDSPYFNPPWTPFLLLPIALLPVKLGEAVAVACGIIAYALIALRFGAGRLALILFMLSPPVLFDLYAGNITWLAMSGLLMPPWLGLFFVLSKPHIGIGIAIYWWFEAWSTGGYKRAVSTFLPVCAGFLLSYLIFGPWFLSNRFLLDVPYNKSIFPWGIPIGIVLLYFALRQRKLKLSVASSSFFAPYFPLHGWIPLMLGLLPDARLLILFNALIIVVSVIVGGFF